MFTWAELHARWGHYRLLPRIGFAFVLFCLGPHPLAGAADESIPSFFGSVEIRSSNLAPFKKWETALQRYSEESTREQIRSCRSTLFNTCYYDDWRRFLDRIRSDDPWDQLTQVNHYMNTRPYITDPRNWGVADYWETPGEFLDRFGDCEDYAIAKYLSLKRLGWSEEHLRVVAVKDLNLAVGHAVLIVYYRDKTWLLDNQIKPVVDTESVRHYRPVFSINERFWWRHRV